MLEGLIFAGIGIPTAVLNHVDNGRNIASRLVATPSRSTQHRSSTFAIHETEEKTAGYDSEYWGIEFAGEPDQASVTISPAATVPNSKPSACYLIICRTHHPLSIVARKSQRGGPGENCSQDHQYRLLSSTPKSFPDFREHNSCHFPLPLQDQLRWVNYFDRR